MPYYKGVLDELIAKGHLADAQEVAARLLSLRNRLEKQLPEQQRALEPAPRHMEHP